MTEPSDPLPLTRESVCNARERTRGHVHLTPVLTSQTLNNIISTAQTPEALKGTPWEGQEAAKPTFRFFFKCENFQKIGAFKIRGASHALSRLSKEELQRGVLTTSSGNHAQALALAATRFHTTAHIVMPSISTPSKIAGTKAHGPQVYFSGSTEPERMAVAREVQNRTNAVFIPPFDHPDIILGQGTMALELEEQYEEIVAGQPGLSVHSSRNGNGYPTVPALASTPKQRTGSGHAGPGLDAVIAPLGGGGMLAGIATALAPTRTLVFGAEPSFQGGDDGARGLAQGQRIEEVKTLTIADGLRTPVGKLNWEVVSDREKVAGVYAVSEAQIRRAMRLVMERLKVVVEPSAVVGVAVAMFDEGFRRRCERDGGWDLGVVLSGGNVGMDALGELLAGDREGEERDGKCKDEGSELERDLGLMGMDGEKDVENVLG